MHVMNGRRITRQKKFNAWHACTLSDLVIHAISFITVECVCFCAMRACAQLKFHVSSICVLDATSHVYVCVKCVSVERSWDTLATETYLWRTSLDGVIPYRHDAVHGVQSDEVQQRHMVSLFFYIRPVSGACDA